MQPTCLIEAGDVVDLVVVQLSVVAFVLRRVVDQCGKRHEMIVDNVDVDEVEMSHHRRCKNALA